MQIFFLINLSVHNSFFFLVASVKLVIEVFIWGIMWLFTFGFEKRYIVSGSLMKITILIFSHLEHSKAELF